MAFSQVPKESRSQINKAGEILAKESSPFESNEWAIELVQKWRACHAYPINTFNASLRDKLKSYGGDPLAAQRLKRMPTIIDKLRRYPGMQLTRMQDIGGVRAILKNVDDVYSLADKYRKSRRLAHELVGEHDYIKTPRDEDGYRSVHLIYKYKNKLAPTYNGLRLELQIRTKVQHIWATAVETMGTFLGQALKSRKGEKEWLDFFALVSSVFAYKEKTSRIPRFQHLSEVETIQAISKAESSLQALQKMEDFSLAVNAITLDKAERKWFYHLIILNSLKRTVTLRPYDRESIKQAMEDYSKYEAQAAQGEKIEPVLVSAGPIDKLSRAYPNFFLDIREFTSLVKGMITRN